MRVRRALLAGASLTCLLAAAAARADAPKGVFGLTVAVTGAGWFNPRIQSARVTAVQPGQPAERAGIAAGDEVLEVDGRRIPGATASDLAPLAEGKRPGESLSVRMKRPNGSEYGVTMVAAPPARP